MRPSVVPLTSEVDGAAVATARTSDAPAHALRRGPFPRADRRRRRPAGRRRRARRLRSSPPLGPFGSCRGSVGGTQARSGVATDCRRTRLRRVSRGHQKYLTARVQDRRTQNGDSGQRALDADGFAPYRSPRSQRGMSGRWRSTLWWSSSERASVRGCRARETACGERGSGVAHFRSGSSLSLTHCVEFHALCATECALTTWRRLCGGPRGFLPSREPSSLVAHSKKEIHLVRQEKTRIRDWGTRPRRWIHGCRRNLGDHRNGGRRRDADGFVHLYDHRHVHGQPRDGHRPHVPRVGAFGHVDRRQPLATRSTSPAPASVPMSPSPSFRRRVSRRWTTRRTEQSYADIGHGNLGASADAEREPELDVDHAVDVRQRRHQRHQPAQPAVCELGRHELHHDGGRHRDADTGCSVQRPVRGRPRAAEPDADPGHDHHERQHVDDTARGEHDGWLLVGRFGVRYRRSIADPGPDGAR